MGSDMHQEISNFANLCREGFSHTKKIEHKFKKIVYCGMGGSGISGNLLEAAEPKLRFVVEKGYDLPLHEIDDDTLVIIASYSGNTEETLSCMEQAIKKKAKIVAIGSNGKVESICKKKKITMVKIPAGHQPRAAVPIMFFAILKLFENSKMIKTKEDAEETIKLLEENQKGFEEQAKIISQDIARKIPIIYSADSIAGVSLRWKTQINENAKQPAFNNVFPEMNHNELVSYTAFPENFAVIVLKDRQDHPRIKKRMSIFKKLVGEKTKIIEVESTGKSLLARIMSLVLIGDWVSYYLAIMNNQDPVQVEIIENLKKELKN